MPPMEIIDRPCRKHDRRPWAVRPRVIVIHFSATLTTEEIFDIFLRGPLEVSSHYVVDDGGAVYRLVSEDLRAWHAGQSVFQGIPKVNDFSIGIELRNAGRLVPAPDGSGLVNALGSRFRPGTGNRVVYERGAWWESYAERQMRSLVALCRDISGRYDILPSHVVGHSDVAVPPGRKVDPGPLFDWPRLRRSLAAVSKE